jgi:hypothetical protein
MCGFNEASIKAHIALPNIRTIINALRKGSWGATYDLYSAVHQLLIKSVLPSLVCFLRPDRTWVTWMEVGECLRGQGALHGLSLFGPNESGGC